MSTFDFSTLGDSIFDCDSPLAHEESDWIAPLDSPARYPADTLDPLLSSLSDELLQMLLSFLDAQALGALTTCGLSFSGPVASAVPLAVGALGLLQLPERRHGEGWARVLKRAELRMASVAASRRLAAGHHEALAILDGRVHCMHIARDGVRTCQLAPSPSLPPMRVWAVACGAMHTLVLFEGGLVLQQETAKLRQDQVLHGQLLQGQGSSDELIASISCGAFHSLLIGALGSLWTQGHNSSGQLGLGHFETVASESALPVVDIHPARVLQADGGMPRPSLALV